MEYAPDGEALSRPHVSEDGAMPAAHLDALYQVSNNLFAVLEDCVLILDFNLFQDISTAVSM